MSHYDALNISPLTTFEKVREVIVEIMVIREVNTVQLDSSLRRDLAADSLDELQILHGIEESCGVNFDDMCISRFRTVSDLVEMVNNMPNNKM